MTTVRDRFLQAAKRRFEDVEIAGLGPVRIRNLSEGERSKIEAATHVDNQKESGSGTARWKARMILATVVDEENKPVFSEADLNTVMAIDAAVSDPLYDAIVRHCEAGVTPEEQEKN